MPVLKFSEKDIPLRHHHALFRTDADASTTPDKNVFNRPEAQLSFQDCAQSAYEEYCPLLGADCGRVAGGAGPPWGTAGGLKDGQDLGILPQGHFKGCKSCLRGPALCMHALYGTKPSLPSIPPVKNANGCWKNGCNEVFHEGARKYAMLIFGGALLILMFSKLPYPGNWPSSGTEVQMASVKRRESPPEPLLCFLRAEDPACVDPTEL